MWYTLPTSVPANNQLCWVRVKYFYSSPFLAFFNSTTNEFTSFYNSIVFPAWSIARWKSALGFELIGDPLFDDTGFWSCGSRWSISSNKASYVNTAESLLYSDVTLAQNANYLMSFTVTDCASTSLIQLTDDSYDPIFKTPYADPFLIANGSYNLLISAAGNSSAFNIYAYDSNDSFGLTYFSLKPIV